MREVVYGPGRVSTDSDGSKRHSVSGEQCEQQGVACDWRMNELHVAKAEELQVAETSCRTIEGKNSMKGGELKNSTIRLALWAGH